jgi:predicted NUDIX family phosphoesterase
VTPDELVYAVPRAQIMADPGWHGLETDPRVLTAVLDVLATRGTFHRRAAVEPDRSMKQVIPYLMLRDGGRIFLMRRTRAGGDARLHDLYTIGVGGHLNPGDGGIDGGLEREWREELDADFLPSFRLVGLLNDDTTDVGSVHVGVVYEADAAGRQVAIRETDKLSGAFATTAAIRAVHDQLEGWSRLLFDGLERA